MISFAQEIVTRNKWWFTICDLTFCMDFQFHQFVAISTGLNMTSAVSQRLTGQFCEAFWCRWHFSRFDLVVDIFPPDVTGEWIDSVLSWRLSDIENGYTMNLSYPSPTLQIWFIGLIYAFKKLIVDSKSDRLKNVDEIKMYTAPRAPFHVFGRRILFYKIMDLGKNSNKKKISLLHPFSPRRSNRAFGKSLFIKLQSLQTPIS